MRRGRLPLPTTTRLNDILARAGFRDIRIGKFDGKMNMGTTLEEAAVETLNIGPLSRAAAELDETTREKIRATVAVALRPYQTPHGVRPPLACWLVGARG